MKAYVPREASSLILFRPLLLDVSSVQLAPPGKGVPDFQVLLLERSLNCTSLPGFTVFPGGLVDAVDHELARCVNLPTSPCHATLAKAGALLDQQGSKWMAHQLAAIRETVEEAGIGMFTPPPHALFSPEQWARFRQEVCLSCLHGTGWARSKEHGVILHVLHPTFSDSC
jgi:8-oxo-dGTP pyrophosphatase MutT (NUDIX family)